MTPDPPDLPPEPDDPDLAAAYIAEALSGVRMPWPDVLGHAGLFAAACGVQVLED